MAKIELNSFNLGLNKTPKIIQVVAGVLLKDRHVLMVTRPENKICAGSWEFPGGKIENNELVIEALARELKEEINIIIKDYNCQDLVNLTQEYPHGLVNLQVKLVKKWQGSLKALEGQIFYWQDIQKNCDLRPLLLTTEKILNELKGKF